MGQSYAKPDTRRQKNKLIDPFGRTVDYLRVSVTDRCDFRCVYCMAEEMTFLPADLLTLEELDIMCRRFSRWRTKIRLTGGEPLVRRNIMQLIESLGKEVNVGNLDELTITSTAASYRKWLATLRQPVSADQCVNRYLDGKIPSGNAMGRSGQGASRVGGSQRGRSRH